MTRAEAITGRLVYVDLEKGGRRQMGHLVDLMEVVRPGKSPLVRARIRMYHKGEIVRVPLARVHTTALLGRQSRRSR